MEPKSFCTPQKIFKRQSPTMKLISSSKLLGTPQTKFKGSETPKSISHRSSNGHFSIFPVLNTPPMVSRFPKVVNPFEAALAERLHLPLICSPSLFQRPSTPQHSSTQFEWTIDEVSSLGPANVEPHETQFDASTDPDMEAAAQAAISSYFKEQIIVPSPVDCPLRSRKIVLHDSNGSSPAVRSGRRIRDAVTQTVMSIPPVVTLEVEKFLERFLTYTGDQQQSPTIDCDITIDYEAQDNSLRRKLFGVPSSHSDETCDGDISEIIVDKEHSPPPITPELDTQQIPLRGFGSPFGNNSFGALSPISKLNSSNTTPKRHFRDEIVNIAESTEADGVDMNKSPQSTSDTLPEHGSGCHQQNQSLYRSTPDRSMISNNADMSVDRSHNRTDRHIINSSKQLFPNDLDITTSEQSFFIADDEDMQISQLSVKSTSSSGSSQHPDTPVRKNRSASRKNLSRSFSFPETDDEDDLGAGMVVLKKVARSTTEIVENQIILQTTTAMDTTERSDIYRTDSGFNDMTLQDESKFKNEMYEMKRKSPTIMEADVSMI